VRDQPAGLCKGSDNQRRNLRVLSVQPAAAAVGRKEESRVQAGRCNMS
jgi:hypothetical protein